jgi:signal transduction histidine kinase
VAIKLFNHQQYDAPLCAEMLSHGVQQTRPHLSFLLAILAVITAVKPLATNVIAIWLSAAFITMLIGFAFKFYYLQQFKAVALSLPKLQQLEKAGIFYSACVGLLWGNSSHLLLAGEVEHNLVVTMIYLGVCAGAGSIAIFGLGHFLVGSIGALWFFIGYFPYVFPLHWLELSGFFIIYHAVLMRMALERNAIIIANMRLRRDKEQLLVQQQQEVEKAQQANIEKSAFLAAASHDLRQPVHALMLLGHALKLRLPTGENVRLVERILEAGQALAEQFNNLMDLSHMEGGIYKLNIQRVHLAEFIYRQSMGHQQVAQQKNVQIRIKIDHRLQQQAIESDQALLGRVLDNLLANAIKFSRPQTKVLVTLRLINKHIVLSVYDQGIGFPLTEKKQIFKPYVQLNNANRDRAKGIGLGLSIVHEATVLLAAKVDVKSTVGRGSCFSLVLPQSPSYTIQPLVYAAKPANEQQSLDKLRHRKLLLVEDDPMSAQALMTWAQDLGLVVDHHPQPDTVMMAEKPDIIICDIRLASSKDGIEWLSEWLVYWPDARGLLISGELAAETHERAEQEGLLLLSKPVDPAVLLQTFMGLLR